MEWKVPAVVCGDLLLCVLPVAYESVAVRRRTGEAVARVRAACPLHRGRRPAREAYGCDAATRYAYSGISAMNGTTGHQEVVAVEDFRTLARCAHQRRPARPASVSRDRPRGKLACPAEDRCSGVQQPWEFTRALVAPWRSF
ncbi:hypothetical protein ACQEU8_29095 [Streptomyces sp. CA-250714]|uniref:hypothetical protein n=1 Tax=Streptomyces sp. CA-250714 TaxID=3240060 RepID=UPI003D94E75B